MSRKNWNDRKIYYPPSPQYTPNFPLGSNSHVFAPALTVKLEPAPEKGLTEDQNTKEDKDLEMNYDSDNTVNILRSELI